MDQCSMVKPKFDLKDEFLAIKFNKKKMKFIRVILQVTKCRPSFDPSFISYSRMHLNLNVTCYFFGMTTKHECRQSNHYELSSL
jgi:hypothetical protein